MWTLSRLLSGLYRKVSGSTPVFSAKDSIRVKAQGGPLDWGSSVGWFDSSHPDSWEVSELANTLA